MRIMNVIHKEFSKGSKYLLVLDEHLENLYTPLKEMGSFVEVLEKGMSDLEIHRYLNKKRKSEQSRKPHILITRNAADFEDPGLGLRRYHLFEIKQLHTEEKMANKITDALIKKVYPLVDGGKTVLK